jgi:hypothetical protein
MKSLLSSRPALVGALLLSLAGCAAPGVQDNIPELDIGPTIVPPEAPSPAAPTLPAIPPTVINHGPRNVKRIALTFDGCSTIASRCASLPRCRSSNSQATASCTRT